MARRPCPLAVTLVRPRYLIFNSHFGQHRSNLGRDGPYPQDERGAELSENARAWHIYTEVAHKADTAMTDGWNRSMDVLLVFVSAPLQRVAAILTQVDRSLFRRADYIHHPSIPAYGPQRS